MAGFSPASTNSSNLPQSQVVFHDKKFVKNLKAKTPYLRGCERKPMPKNSGNQLRLYMYQTFAANVTQTSEGAVGSGITPSVLTTTATIGQYADYVNVSDFALETSIDDSLENIQKELAYRLGLTLSTIVKNTADGANAIDSSVLVQKPANVPFSRTDITNQVQSLLNRNVQVFDKGRNCMAGFISPCFVGDTINDVSNNSLTDVLKHTVEGQMKLKELPGDEEVQVLEWGGVCWYSTTLVTQTANYKGSGSTALRAYIFGEDGIFAISLGDSEGAIDDGDYRNLKLYMFRAEKPTVSDPSRVIGGWTSYNVKFTVSLPPDLTQRIRCIDAVSLIS